jgi:hypothetical protein
VTICSGSNFISRRIKKFKSLLLLTSLAEDKELWKRERKRVTFTNYMIRVKVGMLVVKCFIFWLQNILLAITC